MEFNDCFAARRTIRSFLDQDVPEKLLEDLISQALWAPSWGNTMPFELVAATGQALADFKKENQDAILGGVTPNPDVTMPDVWPDYMKARYKEVGRAVLGSQGIARDDQQARLDYFVRMFRLFDAPALVLLTIKREVALEYAMLDAGLFFMGFCLAAQNRGLGTAILAAAVNYPDLARKFFAIPDDRLVVMGVGVGWPDLDDPVNSFERKRPGLEEMVPLCELKKISFLIRSVENSGHG